jgi:hypothetical protein
MQRPTFPDILEAVRQDVIRAASHYPLVTEFFFKTMNQLELVDDYRWLLPELYLAVTGSMVMTLGRLFESGTDSRTASLTTFLLGVETHHGRDADVAPHLRERRAAFLGKIEEWRGQIKAVEKQLVLVRNASWAHNDLTKVGRSDIPWAEIKEMISLAESMVRSYAYAFYETDQRFVVVNADSEIDAFLNWCRLDDYTAHRARWRERRRAAIKEGGRRRREGDPHGSRPSAMGRPIGNLALGP